MSTATVAAVTKDLVSLPVLRVLVRIDEWQEALWAAACGTEVVRVSRRVHVIETQPTTEE